MKKTATTMLMVLSAAILIANMFVLTERMNSYEVARVSAESAKITVSAPRLVLPTLDIEAPVVALEPQPETDPLEEGMEYLLGLDLDSLRQVNPDVLGWIVIPGTVIDYPLMVGETNSEYLTTTWDLKPANAGSIFLECKTNPDFSDFNTIIYGHNMKGGSMFAALKGYGSQSFADEHPHVYIVTDSLVRRYDIYSSYEAEIIGPAYWLGTPKESARESFMEYSLGRSVIDMGIIPTAEDSILTLSTCTGNGTYDTRWVAQAVLSGEFER